MRGIELTRSSDLEIVMTPQDLQVQEKKELEPKEEKTEVGRYYMPYTDIHESTEAIIVTMEMPGVEKKNVDIKLEKNVLTITGRIELSKYEGLEPIYTEYNVGNYTRSFTVSSEIDREGISARIADGVLAVELPKRKEAVARQIEIQ